MRFNSVGFALSVGMALIVVLFGFTLLSAAGLAGFAADEAEVAKAQGGCGVIDKPLAANAVVNLLPAEAKLAALGDALFKNNCAQCHAVDEQVVGPALGGITRRRPIAWILPWVKNSSKVVASGDEYAANLFNKFNKQQMPSFALSDQEIASIVAYINSQEGALPAVAAVR
ncbi:c-type cytochrome [Hymenobacter terricola]|uniref:c-type cytochrome n=1 Tax=Hymenobacter terricola TaxID=2819236 RepID=UPI001CF53173|nr:cytochrome c [Hymenobacter terricola]